MLRTYEKPVVSVDSGLAEGIYAASGSSDNSGIPYKFLRYDGDWGNGGTAVFSLDLSNLNPSQLTIIITCNTTISGGWSNGASNTVSGNSLKLSWYSAPTSAECFIQVQGSDIKELKITSIALA